MKKLTYQKSTCRTSIYVVLLTMLFGMCSVHAFAQEAVDWAKFDRYAEANKKLGAPAKGEKRVVFFGNSITQNWAKLRPAFFSENGYIGRGIGGQTSYHFVVRFREDVINLKPYLVVINAGTNDAAENLCRFDPDITMGNIISLVELARANKIKVILTSVLPAKNFRWRQSITDAPARIAALNERIEAYAKEQKIPYVNYFEKMVDEDGYSLIPSYCSDTVHPIAAGYEVMEAIIKPVIDKMVKK